MKTLYATFAACIVMAIIIPVSPSLAVRQAVLPLEPHFLYMFAHANILHWAINAWALLVLHNTFRWYRLLTAYFIAVTISFIPAEANSSLFTLHSSLPVMGASVITTFFFGFITPPLWKTNRTAVFMMLAFIALGFILPGFAALFHVIPFICGIIFVFIERTVRSFLSFTKL